jgi:GNAT superfamily N-acetyltransferase
MPRLEILPLGDEHVDDAAALLADRHERHRRSEPLLAECDDFRAQIARDLAHERATGVVARRGGAVVGYLVGRVEHSAPDALGFVDLAGCAAADPEDVRDLFTALAARWYDGGLRRFAAMVPASDEPLVDAWFRLAFGCQFVTAARETGAGPDTPNAIVVRRGTADDLEPVASLDRALWRLQAGSPSFSGLDVDAEDFVGEWRDTWDAPDTFPHFVAELEGRVAGHLLLYRRPTGDLRVPDGNIDLAHAATVPDLRGNGVGLALTAHALRWAAEHGYRSMTTDWRSVNLLASRFWPRRGFRPTFLRLVRSVP